MIAPVATSAETLVPRFRALDGLRGVAALLVVLLHVEWSNHITRVRFVANGYLAVDLFFIISGLVISANYSTQIVDVRTFLRFLALRFFRLYPLHFAVLAAFLGLECLKVAAPYALGLRAEHQPFTGGQSLPSLAANIFLVNGLGLFSTPGWNGPSWSISCEFVAYVLFAITAFLGLVRSRAFLVVGALATAIAYARLALTRGTLNVVYDLGLLRCVAGFFWGMLIHRWSIMASCRPLKQMQGYEISVTVAVLLTMATMSGALILIVIPLFILLVALLRSDRGPVARLLTAEPAQYLGRISYSVYMVHEFVILCLRMVLRQVAPTAYDPNAHRALVIINPWIGDVLIFTLVGTVVAIASRTYAWIEEPGRMFGRRALQRDGDSPNGSTRLYAHRVSTEAN
jgi:peptidoglycan/LPS O-acetylase OafA/YrhL